MSIGNKLITILLLWPTFTWASPPTGRINVNGISVAPKSVISQPTAVLPPSAPTYQGPGDIIGGAFAWWGLRAYSNATIGSNAVNLRRDSDNGSQNFVTVPGGNLDLVAINTFKGSANLFVASLYDQTGGGHNALQIVQASQPAFILNAQNGQPVMRLVSATTFLATSTLTLAQPFTVNTVAKRTGGFTSWGYSVLSEAAPIGLGWTNIANTAVMNGGAQLNGAATDNVFHSAQHVFNGASSNLSVDAVSNLGNGGALTMGGVLQIGGQQQGAIPNADIGEVGLWGIAFTPANNSALSANQHSYWGF